MKTYSQLGENSAFLEIVLFPAGNNLGKNQKNFWKNFWKKIFRKKFSQAEKIII